MHEHIASEDIPSRSGLGNCCSSVVDSASHVLSSNMNDLQFFWFFNPKKKTHFSLGILRDGPLILGLYIPSGNWSGRPYSK